MTRDRGSVKPNQKAGDWSSVTASPSTGDHQTVKVANPNPDWSSAKPNGPVRNPSSVTTRPSNTGDHQPSQRGHVTPNHNSNPGTKAGTATIPGDIWFRALSRNPVQTGPPDGPSQRRPVERGAPVFSHLLGGHPCSGFRRCSLALSEESWGPAAHSGVTRMRCFPNSDSDSGLGSGSNLQVRPLAVVRFGR